MELTDKQELWLWRHGFTPDHDETKFCKYLNRTKITVQIVDMPELSKGIYFDVDTIGITKSNFNAIQQDLIQLEDFLKKWEELKHE